MTAQQHPEPPLSALKLPDMSVISYQAHLTDNCQLTCATTNLQSSTPQSFHATKCSVSLFTINNNISMPEGKRIISKIIIYNSDSTNSD